MIEIGGNWFPEGTGKFGIDLRRAQGWQQGKFYTDPIGVSGGYFSSEEFQELAKANPKKGLRGNGTKFLDGGDVFIPDPEGKLNEMADEVGLIFESGEVTRVW